MSSEANEKEANCNPCETSGPLGLRGFGFRIGLSLVCAGQGMVFGLGYNNAYRMGEAPEFGSTAYVVLHTLLFSSALAVVLLLGGPLWQELRAAVRVRRISVEALFFLSGLGALVGSLISSFRGTGSLYYEVVSIVLCVYAIGKQVGAVQRGRLGAALRQFRETFDHAQVELDDGTLKQMPVGQLEQGARVLIGPGEPIPVDGLIEEGRGYVRETPLTGEPIPVSRGPGERLRAGAWSVDGTFKVRPGLSKARELDSLLKLLNQRSGQPSRLQESADRLMQRFVPFVSMVALVTFAVWWLYFGNLWDGLFNAMAVLLVACPCALGLALPSGLWAGLYYLSQHGLVGRHGKLLDALADADTVVFDKTGTLTEFEEAVETRFVDISGDYNLLCAVRSLSLRTNHPVSKALAAISADSAAVTQFKVYAGQGLEGNVDGNTVLMGECELLQRNGVLDSISVHRGPGKPLHLAVNGRYMGYLVLQERLRGESVEAISALQELGCKCYILSGDPNPSRKQIAGISVEAGLSAEAKADFVRKLKAQGRRMLFVGDGVNDLQAMREAESALAIDAGAALANELADGVLLQGRVGSLPFAISKARRIRQRLLSNLRFALGYNAIGMALATAGLLHPVVAALLMVLSSAIVSWRAIQVAASI